MKAVGYCRVSSLDQTNGTSLESQKAQIEAYASMKGLELLDVLVDPGVSGSIPLSERPAGRELVKKLESGQAQAVIMCKLDRGFRSASDCLTTVEYWKEKGISLHILNLGGTTIDTGSPTGKFFLTVMAGAAELERNLIRERCIEGRRARKAEGKRIGEVPFGFRVEKDGKTLTTDYREQSVIQFIKNLAAKGRSYRAIADELNRRKIPTKKHGKWYHKQVAQILRRVV